MRFPSGDDCFMIKTLVPYRDDAALVICRALLDKLGIDEDTPLEVVTDGEVIVVSPVWDAAHRQRVVDAMKSVNTRHSETLRRLAE